MHFQTSENPQYLVVEFIVILVTIYFRVSLITMKGNADINNYVFTNKTVLKIVGLYPTSAVRYIICCACMFGIVVPQALQIYQNWRDLSVVLETSSVLLTILLAILKSLVWMYNRKKMDFFIKYMFTDYWKIMTTYVRKGYLFTIGYLFLICNSLIFFISLPIIEISISISKGTNNNGTKHFPFVALYPKSFYNFPVYEIIYFSQMIATSLCGLIIFGTDTLIATALFFTCGHFKVLQEKIKTTMQIDLKQYACDKETTVKNIKLRLKDIVKHHYTILWFCDDMEMLFSPMLFLQTLASSVIICLVGFQITTANITADTISKMIKYISYLFMALFQLLLFCIPGDSLINESTTIKETVYSITWYKLPVSFRIAVCLLILRSQKPSQITGKFYIMHLENFNGVLSTATSYFMLIRAMYNKDQK